MSYWAAVRCPPRKETVVARRLTDMLGCVIYLPKARIVLPLSRRPVTAPLYLGLWAIGEHVQKFGQLGVAVPFHEPGDVVAAGATAGFALDG